MQVKKLTLTAVLSAIALTVFVLEAQIPVPFAVPGLKLGLSNIVTLFALACTGWKSALAIVLIRITLGNLLVGNLMSLLFSLAGGLLSFGCMAPVQKKLPMQQLWVAGVFGGMAHILGQMAVAVCVTDSLAVLFYLPVLLLCGIFTGALTGLSAQLLCFRLKNFAK